MNSKKKYQTPRLSPLESVQARATPTPPVPSAAEQRAYLQGQLDVLQQLGRLLDTNQAALYRAIGAAEAAPAAATPTERKPDGEAG